MANTTYTNFVPPAIDAGWLNDVNNLVYNLAGDGVNAPNNDSDIRTNIGLGTMATQDASAIAVTGGTIAGATITGGSVSGITDLAIADGGTGASTAAAARTNLDVAQIGPTFSASLTANQALVSGVSAVVLYQTEDFDTGSYYDPATGRFTPLVAGYYQVNAGVLMDGNGNNIAIAQAAVFKNGVEWARGAQIVIAAASLCVFFDSTVACVVFLNGTTDFIDFRANCTTGAGNPRLASGLGSRFSAHFIRP